MYVNCVLILMSVIWNRVKDSEAEVDVDMIAKLVEDTLYATQPAMILNLRACVSSPAVRRPFLHPTCGSLLLFVS